MVSTTTIADIVTDSSLQQLIVLQMSLNQPSQLIYTIFCGWSTASPKEQCMKMNMFQDLQQQEAHL